MDKVRHALTTAAAQFRKYEELHRAKLPTADAYDPKSVSDITDKVDANRRMAEMCEEALASMPPFAWEQQAHTYHGQPVDPAEVPELQRQRDQDSNVICSNEVTGSQDFGDQRDDFASHEGRRYRELEVEPRTMVDVPVGRSVDDPDFGEEPQEAE